MPSLARSVPKPLKVPSLARSVSKPLKVPSLARSVPKPLKVPSLVVDAWVSPLGSTLQKLIVGSEVRGTPPQSYRR